MPSDVPDPHDVLARLALVVATTPVWEDLVMRLCGVSVELTGSDGIALNLRWAGIERTTLFATDDVATALEDLQNVLGEGPIFDAARDDRVTTATIGGAPDPRWPQFSEAAVRAVTPPISVLAVPMTHGDTTVGVMTLNRRTSSWVSPPPDSTLRVAADAVVTALLLDPVVGSGANVTGSWPERSRMHQAMGMVIGQLGGTAEDALDLLRAHAFSHSVTLAQVSRDMTEHHLDFKVADPDPSELSVPTMTRGPLFEKAGPEAVSDLDAPDTPDADV